MPATEIPADWAAQRIKNLSLGKRGAATLLRAEAEPEADDHLAHRGVPVPEVRARDDVGALPRAWSRPPGSQGRTCRPAGHPDPPRGRARRRGRAADADGAVTTYPCDARRSRRCRSPTLLRGDGPAGARRRAGPRPTTCAYRDFLTVALVVPEAHAFPDNWIYIHDPEVQVGRIQNFGSWSPYMVKDGRTCLGLEYFVFEGDELWTLPDDDLIELGKRELERARAGRRRRRSRPATSCGCRRRIRSTTSATQSNVDVLRELARRRTRRTCTRSAATACTATTTRTTRCSPRCSRSRTSSGADHDVWAVNVEEEYHEEGRGTGRDAPVLPQTIQHGRAAVPG